MQAEQTKDDPKFHPLKTDGVQPQTESHLVTHVLVSGEWVEIAPGSFHYYVTDAGKPLPYIEFRLDDKPYHGSMAGRTVQVWPQTVGGVAF